MELNHSLTVALDMKKNVAFTIILLPAFYSVIPKKNPPREANSVFSSHFYGRYYNKYQRKGSQDNLPVYSIMSTKPYSLFPLTVQIYPSYFPFILYAVSNRQLHQSSLIYKHQSSYQPRIYLPYSHLMTIQGFQSSSDKGNTLNYDNKTALSYFVLSHT